MALRIEHLTASAEEGGDYKTLRLVDGTNVTLTFAENGGKATVTVADSTTPTFSGLFVATDIEIFTNAGAPSNGTTGANVAGKGSLCIDTTNGKLYINTNTKASPTWTVVGTQS